ncbi:TIGR00266 family protein [Thermanaerosceptrum fracticalcis]|uniref:TIGR00266 family protein n=1 Tax=Thermanaerosceptrum fracticalcis TaxID=1712410 RepID=A0A7G6DZX4_THEFR|nr:TIGR00266 family protein [Thermanaerosceptrum fracticalcis]
MFCPKCGGDVRSGKFCPKCGTSLGAADVISYRIYGDDMQLVEIELDPGEGVRAEAGAMTYMTQGIEMSTSSSGGIMGGLKRVITGESFFIISFINNGRGKQQVAFGSPYPGKIIPLQLRELGGTFLCQKDSYLCSALGIEINVAFTKKIGAGFFGGEGFILQKLSGDGLAFVHAGGTVIKKELAPGETLRVDTGCLVAFASTVDYDITMVRGFKNMLFGGEGLFLATLTGPGLVYIQSLPLSRLADRIAAATRVGGRREEQTGRGSIAGSKKGIFGRKYFSNFED